MSDPTETIDESNAPLSETAFLEALEAETLEPTPLVEAVTDAWDRGEKEPALAWADLLLDALVERGLCDAGLPLLAKVTAWRASDADYGATCRALVDRFFDSRREQRGLIKEAGFDEKISTAEAMSRLCTLVGLDRGTLCVEKTWGFGIVQDVDLFYNKVIIDFDSKSDHEMTLSYAAQALTLIDKDHLMARKHESPEAVAEMVAKDPAEVVKICLRSYGPLNVVILQERLVPDIVSETGWKKFWDGARKQLKQDPLVDIPSKRSEQIKLRAKKKAYDDTWLDSLSGTRDLKKIPTRITEYRQAHPGEALSERHREVIGERLAFLVKGADPRFPGLMAQGLMLAASLELTIPGHDTDTLTRRFFEPDIFNRAVRQLPARLVSPFLEHLISHDREVALDALVGMFTQLDVGVLNDVVLLLCAHGREEDVAAFFRGQIETQNASIEVMNWILRNPERIKKWSLGSLTLLTVIALSRIEDPATGEHLKAQNQLRERFARDEWFLAALGEMDESKRMDFLYRLKDSTGYETMDLRSLLGKAIKAYPELQEVTATRQSEENVPRRGPVTSYRSYTERQAQLQQIVNVDIPENSREIAVARSYGDLRENHEFKAAKEMQGILMRRQGELEKMLNEVTPIDFRSYEHSGAGIATGVTLAYDDGREEQYFILGEWDRDEKLGIISCTTRMAQALDGRKAGDRIVVPTEDGEVTCLVKEVSSLPSQVLEWVDVVPEDVEAEKASAS